MPAENNSIGAPPAFNRTDGRIIDFLLSRRSTLARQMTEPGPDRREIEKILAAGARVPDHGKLAPWRFVVFQGAACAMLGDVIAEGVRVEEPEMNEDSIEALRKNMSLAPTVIAALSTPTANHKIPLWEQYLSAGAACQNIIIAASCLGYAAQWVTGRGAYCKGVYRFLEMDDHDQIAGFIFLGSASETPLKERPRPALSDIVSWR